jgi:hypothetical protein
MMNVRDMAPTDQAGLRFVDAAHPAASAAQPLATPAQRKKESAVLRGIKDLQDLQKQTIAVLESVKGTLDDIQQVLRSPEATRGMEKQRNAATLLAKGFAREAIEQAQGAVNLLPANPESHLLLSLSLAADQQFDASLAIARKGLALIDRRNHPLAIECGLLHALAALGCGPEALDRWSVIIDALPLPVLFEQLSRIAACFPSQPLGGGDALLDEWLTRRLARDEQAAATLDPAARRARLRQEGTVETRPDEIPAPALLAALDAAHEFHLLNTHRALLAQVARRLQFVLTAADVVKFIGECVVPLANRGLDRSAGALARASVKRLLRFHADVQTLHRAMTKLELAGATVAMQEIASLLHHWRTAGNRVHRAYRGLQLSAALLAGGLLVLAYVLWFMNGGALAGHATTVALFSRAFDALFAGPAIMAVGGILGVYALLGRTWHVALPEGRPPLSANDLRYLNTPPVRQAIRAILGNR